MRRYIILVVSILVVLSEGLACTSLIVSGRRTTSGKPILYKNRDTDCLDNRLEWFEQDGIRFIGLVNAPSKGGEVWAGLNEFGFAIMNTAVYNFSEDSLHASVPFEDREGVVMFKALSRCRNVHDFLVLLDTMPKPLGVQTNFGVIDRQGGALYVETNNWRYVVFDVNEEACGYRVQTNFAFSGDSTKVSGWERYLTASDILAEWDTLLVPMDASWTMQHLSRSYRHSLMGWSDDYCPKSGIAVDQDFIPRCITSAVVAVEDDVMWTWLGYPATAIAVPAMVCDADRLPAAAKKTDADSTCRLCNYSLRSKRQVFPFNRSNGHRYMDMRLLMLGDDSHQSLLNQCARMDSMISQSFLPLYRSYKQGGMAMSEFAPAYQLVLDSVYRKIEGVW